MEKKSISVREMRDLLGIGYTESYWLLKKNFFETRTVFGKTRIMVESFEQWYARQFWYKKVDGTPPGAQYRISSLSIQEAAELLNISKQTVYDIMKRNPDIAYSQIGRNRRISYESLMNWCAKTERYCHITRKTKEGMEHEDVLLSQGGSADIENATADNL